MNGYLYCTNSLKKSHFFRSTKKNSVHPPPQRTAPPARVARLLGAGCRYQPCRGSPLLATIRTACTAEGAGRSSVARGRAPRKGGREVRTGRMSILTSEKGIPQREAREAAHVAGSERAPLSASPQPASPVRARGCAEVSRGTHIRRRDTLRLGDYRLI
jgi:hypothetical protein